MKLCCVPLTIALALASFSVAAADYPAPKETDWIARDFKFHTGEVLPELRLHYTTIGDPSGQPVLVLHGSGSSASGMLTPGFAGELFGPGHRSTPPNITSSFPTASVTAKAQSHLTV